jgi:hypothetical protein
MDEERKESRDEDPAPVKNSDAERVPSGGEEAKEAVDDDPPGAPSDESVGKPKGG